MEQRDAIQFCFKLAKTTAEMFETMQKVYGKNYWSCGEMFEWFSRFKNGRWTEPTKISNV